MTKKVLIVEDDHLMREHLQHVFEVHEVAAVLAANAKIGLSLLRQDSNIKLVLSDYMLKGSDNGLWLLAEVKKLNPPLPFILMTGSVLEEQYVLQQGADAVFFKPFDVFKVMKKIQGFLDLN